MNCAEYNIKVENITEDTIPKIVNLLTDNGCTIERM